MRVTVLGATGFVGRAVMRELVRKGAHVRAVCRRPPRLGSDGRTHWVPADLAEPDSLRGVCEGSDVLLQLASYIGPDPAVCDSVNVRGTEAAVREARRAGVRRIVQLSTAAVYGAGPHNGIEVGGVAEAPVSAASRTRLAAEGQVLAAGGSVLRPGLILGPGDRWVVPAFMDALRRVPAWWDGGRSLLSVVDVDDLARLIVGASALDGGIHHASHPRPVRSRELIAELARHGIGEAPWQDKPLDQCLAELRGCPGSVSERQFRLLAEDHWYRSEEVWRSAGVAPAPDSLSSIARAADWYRAQLRDPVACG